MNKNSKPSLVYYDININNVQSTGDHSQPLRFSEMRNTPIIRGAKDYTLSIVRFQLDMVYKPNLIYVPSAEYRHIDMHGVNDIKNIDINVFWHDREGMLIPFILQSGTSCSIKLLFKLKD